MDIIPVSPRGPYADIPYFEALPPVPVGELRTLEFEVRAKAANGAVLAMGALIRDCRQEIRELIAYLNTLGFNDSFRRQAKVAGSAGGGKRGVAAYYQREYDRVLAEIAALDAQIRHAEDEEARFKAEWEPLQELASGMRRELECRRTEERNERTRATMNREQEFTDDQVLHAAERAKQLGPHMTDDLAGEHTLAARRQAQIDAGVGRARVSPAGIFKPATPLSAPTAQVAAAPRRATDARSAHPKARAGVSQPGTTNWLSLLQEKAYGKDVDDGKR